MTEKVKAAAVSGPSPRIRGEWQVATVEEAPAGTIPANTGRIV